MPSYKWHCAKKQTQTKHSIEPKNHENLQALWLVTYPSEGTQKERWKLEEQRNTATLNVQQLKRSKYIAMCQLNETNGHDDGEVTRWENLYENAPNRL